VPSTGGSALPRQEGCIAFDVGDRSVEPLTELIDGDALAELLRRIDVDPGPLTLGLLAGGASNLTFRITTSGAEYVLRRRPLGPTSHHVDHRDFPPPVTRIE
jgi:hypothetical protein